MRNKKYRSWKGILIVIGLGIIEIVLGIILFSGFKRICCIIFGSITISSAILFFIQYFEIQNDRIIVRGANSLVKNYDSSFRKFVFMFDEIKDICVEQRKIVWITLKDDTSISIPIQGRLRRNEIIGLIYEVRAQIKGYEQQNI